MVNERNILGLNWDAMKDNFVLRFDWLVQYAEELPFNKRSVLKIVTKLYDPLGFISQRPKSFSNIFCKLKVYWDEPLSEEVQLQYSSWLSDWLKIMSILIARCYFQSSAENLVSLQLHGFGDSSEVAYATVVYLRIERIRGISTELVMSKARVAPLARQIIPRLELLAALILSRLVTRVRTALLPIIQLELN